MNQEFGTKQIEAQQYAGIRNTVTIDKIGEVIGSMFGEVFGHIQQNGQRPAGKPFALYHSMDGDSVDLECGIPVNTPVPGTNRVRAGELPAGTVATVTHVGPYDNLPQTWSALTDWMSSQGLEPAGAPWEVYVTDPGEVADQSKWRTDIYFPVR